MCAKFISTSLVLWCQLNRSQKKDANDWRSFIQFSHHVSFAKLGHIQRDFIYSIVIFSWLSAFFGHFCTSHNRLMYTFSWWDSILDITACELIRLVVVVVFALFAQDLLVERVKCSMAHVLFLDGTETVSLTATTATRSSIIITLAIDEVCLRLSIKKAQHTASIREVCLHVEGITAAAAPS